MKGAFAVTLALCGLYLSLTFKVLNGLAPQYLTDLIQSHCPGRPLRSSDKVLLSILKSNLRQKGDCAFCVAGPKPATSGTSYHYVRTAPATECFETPLKAHLFSLSF